MPSIGRRFLCKVYFKKQKSQGTLDLSEIYSPNIGIIYLSELQSWLVAYGRFWENEYEKKKMIFDIFSTALVLFLFLNFWNLVP